jgi:phosphate transport system substrate-binding protein
MAGSVSTVVSLSFTAAVGEPINIQGSSTFYARLIEPYRADIERKSGYTLDVISSKTIHGLMALLEGRARMAMMSSDLDKEKQALKADNPGLPVDDLRSFDIARTRIAIIVNKSIPLRRMGLDDLARVLKGEFANWRSLGGPDLAISLVTVQPGGGVPMSVRNQLLDGQAFAARKIIQVESPRHVVQVTMQLPGAIGLTQLGLAREAALPEVQLDRRIEQELNLVTLGEPDAALQSVIDAARAVAQQHLN